MVKALNYSISCAEENKKQYLKCYTDFLDKDLLLYFLSILSKIRACSV